MTNKKFNSELTPRQQLIYVELSQFNRDHYDGDGTCFDLASYAVGYYGAMDADVFTAIMRLLHDGAVRA